MPVSMKRSWKSRRRQRVPLSRYSERPSRNTLRVMATSLKSTFRDCSQSPMVKVTSAIPRGLRFSVPLKMTSAISPPRRAFAEVSPRTQRIASTTLDFPQPLGPTMPVTPWANSKTVRSAKDLKPWISRVLRYMADGCGRGFAERIIFSGRDKVRIDRTTGYRVCRARIIRYVVVVNT